MDGITLTDGTKFDGYALESNSILYLHMTGGVMGDYFQYFYDPEKTSRIIEERNGVITEYAGYTHLFYIREDRPGKINVGLKKE